jgi:hypothetical protein
MIERDDHRKRGPQLLVDLLDRCGLDRSDEQHSEDRDDREQDPGREIEATPKGHVA